MVKSALSNLCNPWLIALDSRHETHSFFLLVLAFSSITGNAQNWPSFRDGDVFVVKAGRQCELLSKNVMGQPLMATSALTQGMLIVRGDTCDHGQPWPTLPQRRLHRTGRHGRQRQTELQTRSLAVDRRKLSIIKSERLVWIGSEPPRGSGWVPRSVFGLEPTAYPPATARWF
jgi:hypothetical protein